MSDFRHHVTLAHDTDEPVEAEVYVSYQITGRYWPGNREEPPEYPELEVIAAALAHNVPELGLDEGDDVYSLLSAAEQHDLEHACWTHADNMRMNYP